jgi:probable HAF family extracellular repeat protein
MEDQIMGLPSSLRGLFRPAHLIRRRPGHRLTVEALEGRLCPSYTVMDLGTLGGGWSVSRSLNAAGQVVGQSRTTGGQDHAFLWQAGAMTDLGTLGGTTSAALSINDDGATRAVLWTGGLITELGTLGGSTSSAHDINNNGQVVGVAQTGGGATHGFVWEAGALYDLNSLLPANSGWQLDGGTYDINDSGQIAGTGLINGHQHAFLLTDPDGTFANGGAVIADLGTLGGISSSAGDLNGSGQVVGGAKTKDGSSHAFRSSAGMMTDLKTLGGSYSIAQGVNDAGQVVGWSEIRGGAAHAFLWQNGKMADLNKELPRGSAWTLDDTADVNNAGHIAGSGLISGQRHAFLMVPGDSALLAESVGTATFTEALRPDRIRVLLGEAVARWQSAGFDPSALTGLDVRVADLGGATLGLAAGRTIWLDDNAAGWGWFVDQTPGNDSEFARRERRGRPNRMDLLTVLAHEVGHLLGFGHAQGGVMQETLSAGERLTPGAGGDTLWLIATDGFFARAQLKKRR